MHADNVWRRWLGGTRPLLPSLETREDLLRNERTLAAGRAFLATSALAAIYLDPTEPTRYAALAYTLLIAYAAASIGIVAFLRFSRPSRRQVIAFAVLVHAGDVCFAAIVTLFTAGPNSPFFVFFVFALLAAAYRWGLAESLTTAAAGVTLLIIEALLVVQNPSVGLVEGDFELNRLVIRATYLIIIGVLAGFLAERQRELRREEASIAWVLARARGEDGVKDTMQLVLGAVLHMFGSRHALCVIEDHNTRQIVKWEARLPGEGDAATVRWDELDAATRETYLFAAPGHAWHLARRRLRFGMTGDTLVLDDQGHRVAGAPVTIPESFGGRHAYAALIAVTLPSWEFSGRLFLFDPQRVRDRDRTLQFAQRVVRELAPATYNIYLLHRLRSRAEALERARLARDLHDGITQSLISAEMQVDLLRRQAETEAPRIAHALGRIRTLLRQEVLGLRELMQQMKAFHVGPDQLLDHLADTVDRFQRETGISARFVSNLTQEELPVAPRVSREMARIVHEGLVNARKHSGARNVVVSLTATSGAVKLSIDDDGRGFPFSGRFNHSELERVRKGPQVIKERTRSIGGELTLESTPGHGTRLEITVR